MNVSNFTKEGIPLDWLEVVENRLKDPKDMGDLMMIGKTYIGFNCYTMNKYLREHDTFTTDMERDEHDRVFFENVKSTDSSFDIDKMWNLYNALISLRTKPPSSVNLYRGLPNSVMGKYNVGDIYHDAGFSSFSFSFRVAKGYSAGQSVIVLKNPEEGVWFPCSINDGKYEFVIGPRCLFKILNIFDDDRYKIYVVEFVGYNNW